MPTNRPTMGPPNTPAPRPRPNTGGGDIPVSRPRSGRSSDGLTVGGTGGFVGPTVRSGKAKATAGVGRHGSVGGGVRVRFAEGGSVKAGKSKGSSASKRADGVAKKGKTKGKVI